MIGAIAGDIIGSLYEFSPVKTKDFPFFQKGSRFTDDSVLTVAVARAVLTGEDYQGSIHRLGRKYPDAGYGGSFLKWLSSEAPAPYNSWGNGSAMRVSPVGFAFDTVETVLEEAAKSAVISHNHPEGIKGAQAVALSVYLARTTKNKNLIRREIGSRFGYYLERSVSDIRPNYSFDVSCRGSVPEAIISFLDSDSYEDAVRNAVSLGGDSDTLACIAGGIAEAFYGAVDKEICNKVREILTTELWEITTEFCSRFGVWR
jgi:ADP-ribosylglycohydrolase